MSTDLQPSHRDGGDDAPDPHLETRRMAELLQETRVGAVGVQVIFGFLLIVPFTGDLASADALQRIAWTVAMLAAVVATALLLTPSILHRALLHRGQRPWLVRTGSRVLLAGVATTGVTLVATVVLTLSEVFGAAVALAVGGGVAAALLLPWVVLPLRRRRVAGPPRPR